MPRDYQIQKLLKILKKKKNKNKKSLNLVYLSERKNEAFRNQKIKSFIDFDEDYSSSIKSIAVEESVKINLTTRFLKGKILMFSKFSMKSFVYNLIDIFMFPNDDIKKIYDEYNVQRCYLLGTSDFGRELREDLNTIVGWNEKLNNTTVRLVVDAKNAGIMQNPNQLNLTLCDLKKFDLQNPIIGKIASQVKASKSTEDQLTKDILMQDEIAKMDNRF